MTHVRASAGQDEVRVRESIALKAKSIFDRGLTAGSSGNISVRTEDGWVVTPTNSSFGSLDPAELTFLDLDGRVAKGPAPTKEWPLHSSMYEHRASAGAIVHLHSSHAAAVSCLHGLDEHDCIPPLTAYFVMKIGRLPLVPYYRPGDPAVARAVANLAPDHTAVLLANHGPVVAGASLDEACYAVEELEEAAKLFLMLRNDRTRPLNREQIAELVDTFKLSSKLLDD